jgi:hypothetical protein
VTFSYFEKKNTFIILTSHRKTLFYWRLGIGPSHHQHQQQQHHHQQQQQLQNQQQQQTIQQEKLMVVLTIN